MKKYKTIIVFLLGVIVGGIIQNNQKYFYNSYNLIYDNIYLLNKYIFGPKLAWTMVNVNNSDAQGDAHVIQIKGGKTVLIDAGANVKDKLIPFLNDNRIKYLDYAFISHAHKDHYGGIPILIRNNISINEIYFNLPNKSVCDRELPWGCNYFDVKSHFNFYEKNSIIRKEVNGGEIFDLGNDVILKILYAFDGYNTPFGQTDINDTSLIMSLESGDYKFLFTGDLNAKLSQYIVETSKDIKADVLKVPHHGTEGLARNSFFKKVNPIYALVPSPKSLWCSDRSARPRKWFIENKVKTYINGFSGNIKVQILDNELSVIPEKEVKHPCSQSHN